MNEGAERWHIIRAKKGRKNMVYTGVLAEEPPWTRIGTACSLVDIMSNAGRIFMSS